MPQKQSPAPLVSTTLQRRHESENKPRVATHSTRSGGSMCASVVWSSRFSAKIAPLLPSVMIAICGPIDRSCFAAVL